MGSAGAVFRRKEDKKDLQMERLQEELGWEDRGTVEITVENLDFEKRRGHRGPSSRSGGAAVCHCGRSGADKENECPPAARGFKREILAVLDVGRSVY